MILLIINHYYKKGSSHRAAKFTTKPMGYWTVEKGKNRRKLFEKFAFDEGFDPLVATHWYNYSHNDLKEIKVKKKKEEEGRRQKAEGRRKKEEGREGRDGRRRKKKKEDEI